jgi:outer membrane murein-binding lipoprotein Lpp
VVGGWSGQKCRTLSEKQIKSMTQVVEQLSSKLEALSSIPRAAKKKKEMEEMNIRLDYQQNLFISIPKDI